MIIFRERSTRTQPLGFVTKERHLGHVWEWHRIAISGISANFNRHNLPFEGFPLSPR